MQSNPERDLLIVVNDTALVIGFEILKALTIDAACDAAIITTPSELAGIANGETRYRLGVVVGGDEEQRGASILRRVVRASVTSAVIYIGRPTAVDDGVELIEAPAAPLAVATRVRERLDAMPRKSGRSARLRQLNRVSSSIELHGVSGPKLIPKRIGDYRIERQLGIGAMGAVYLGIHEALDIPVAIKLLMHGANSRDVMRFYREARLAARLEHPNIVRVLGAGEWEKTHYIALQFIEGETASAYIERLGPLPSDRAVVLLTQALSALAHAHSRDCIHRDLKPDNLMITPAGDIKIADFGLARSTGADDMRLTQPGRVVGTPEFMSVEQWEGEAVDHRADLYSLGATFYVMLTGAMPFEGPTHSELVRNVMAGNFVPLDARRSDLPPGLVRAVESLLQRDADQRPVNAEVARGILDSTG